MTRLLFLLILITFISCSTTEKETESSTELTEANSETFDTKKWKVKREGKYLYREAMLDDLVKDQEIRKLDREELLDQLGSPDFYRTDSSYLYYTILEKNFGPITLKSKTLVIKTLTDSVEWMKIHE